MKFQELCTAYQTMSGWIGNYSVIGSLIIFWHMLPLHDFKSCRLLFTLPPTQHTYANHSTSLDLDQMEGSLPPGKAVIFSKAWQESMGMKISIIEKSGLDLRLCTFHSHSSNSCNFKVKKHPFTQWKKVYLAKLNCKESSPHPTGCPERFIAHIVTCRFS